MPFDILISLFLSLLSFQSWRSHINILGAVGDDGSFQHHPAWVKKLGTHLSLLLFLWGRWLPASSTPHCAALDRGWHWQCFPYVLHCFQTHFLLLQWGARLSLPGILDFYKGPHCLPKSALFKFPWLLPKGAGSQATTGSITLTKVCFPITQCTGGQDSSWIPQLMALDPIPPTWMDAKFWLFKMMDKIGMSYAAIILTSLSNLHDFGNDVIKNKKK